MEQGTSNLSNNIISALRAKGLTIQKLAETTGVSERFLEALIEERFDSLPSVPYVRGYLIKIADVLDLDGEHLFEEYLKDNESVKRSGRHDRLPQNRFSTPPLNGKIILLSLVVLGIILYVFLRVPILGGSNGLILYNLKEDITYTDKSVFKVSGHIQDYYKLTLNGERIYSDEDGNFEASIPLQEGFNTFVFGFRKFLLGKDKFVSKQIFYEEPVEEFTQDVPQ